MHAVEAEVIVLLPTLVSNALAERLHTRSARNESNGSWQLVVGSRQFVQSKSRRIVSMRNYLCLGRRAKGDCVTASAPIWVSLCQQTTGS